jgi:hypothetical protein
MNPVIYVTVALILEQGADPAEVVSELDYSFKHPSIIESEIREYEILED